jgi:hypothetical protein
MNIFEEASRKKLRFSVPKGTMNVEDLWDLSLEDLDNIAKGINRQLKAADEESFITTRSKENTIENLRFDVILHVITVKMAEVSKKKLAKERSEKRAQLKELIEKKLRSAQEEKSIEELEKELALLDE